MTLELVYFSSTDKIYFTLLSEIMKTHAEITTQNNNNYHNPLLIVM